MQRRRTRSIATAVASLLVMTAAACGGSPNESNTKADRVLDVVSLNSPPTLNPGLSGISGDATWYTQLAYASLIHHGPGGELQPDLATSWKYVDTENRHFRLTLRQGVKFADGTPVTADAVAKSLHYSLVDSAGPSSLYVGKVNSVTASDDKTIDIKLAEPNPEMPFVLSSTTHLSEIISPKGLADLKKLGHSTAGAGPYILDKKTTVSSDHYTYVPNPNYYDRSKIHYDKVVIKAVGNPNAAVSLLKTGAADVAYGDRNEVGAAETAGLQVHDAFVAQTGILFADRTGAVSKPMGSQLVRQALNYAIDRETIAESLVGDFGEGVNQVGTPGTPDYLESAADQYAYDPDKAKQLLAEAGYPDGFTTDMVIFTVNPPASDVAQAVISDWQKIGVKVEGRTTSDPAKYQADFLSKKYPMASFGYGYLPFFLYAKSFYLPTNNAFNLFNDNDPKLTSLVERGNATSGEEQRELYDQATQRALDLAWIAPVTSFSVFYFASSAVDGAHVDPSRPYLDLTELQPAS